MSTRTNEHVKSTGPRVILGFRRVVTRERMLIMSNPDVEYTGKPSGDGADRSGWYVDCASGGHEFCTGMDGLLRPNDAKVVNGCKRCVGGVRPSAGTRLLDSITDE